MRLGIICVGRMKNGPERELYARYSERIRALRHLGLDGLELREVEEGRERDAPGKIASEGAALLQELPVDACVVVFDERGKAATSPDLAQFVARQRDSGRRSLWCVIGGAEGLDTRLRERAQAVFSFGAMTLPHQIVRILVAEQIYRAMTIISGHPYHRG